MSLLTKWLMGHDETTLTTKQRSTHTYVVGQSGTGKSRALESWIMQDILAGHGVGVIDPHGDLYNHLIARIAKRPELWDKVILFNPLDPNWSVGFNPLEAIDQISAERLALYMMDVTTKVWGLDPARTPRMIWLLTNTFLALVALDLKLTDMPTFLLDKHYREDLLDRIHIPAIREYFEHQFPHSEKAARSWVTPAMNKMGSLMFDPDIRMIFAGNSTIDLRDIMDKEMILLVNLSKGIMGEATSALLAALLVAQMQKTALARANTTHRIPFYLYLDEFQNYTTDNIEDILSESRKYALSLTLAHQFLDQLPREVRGAVLNNTGTMACFRVGYQDARVLAKEIFPAPDFIQIPDIATTLRSFRIKDAGWDGLALEIANLEARQFWTRRRGAHDPIKQYSFNMPDPVMTLELQKNINALREASGQRFARRKQHQQQPQPRAKGDDEDIPLWTS